MESFYNTTCETGQDLIHFEIKAKTQEEAVLELFKKFKRMTASHCFSKYLIGTGKRNTPLTSIRRSMSNLTKAGHLRQTDKKMKGSYGRNEYFYELI